MRNEHPDDTSRRWAALDDEQRERELARDRQADHTPAFCAPPAAKGARVSTAMVALAWAIINGEGDERSALALARLVLDASEQRP